MVTVKQMVEFFFLSLALGLNINTVFLNTSAAGVGILKLIKVICGISLFVGLILILSWEYVFNEAQIVHAFTCGLFVFSYFTIAENSQTAQKRINWFYVLSNGLLITLVYFFVGKLWHPFLFALSSSLLLGSVFFSMVLGHWYLVVPKLSEKFLLDSLRGTFVVLMSKMILMFVGLYGAIGFFSSGTELGWGQSFNWMVLLMRIVWGYVALLILGIFAWKLTKMRSIQSATGILYVMVFFVFCGELISSYLYYLFGLMI